MSQKSFWNNEFNIIFILFFFNSDFFYVFIEICLFKLSTLAKLFNYAQFK